jgi:DNA-binding MarR family transcriptional regulator
MNDPSAGSRKRLNAVRAEVAASAEKEPLRRRLLMALGEGASTPTQLSKDVDASKEAVSRKLGEMRDTGLVSASKNADDRRRTTYSLTRAGRSELGRHVAFGEHEEVQLPNSREVVVFLREALAAAVAMRRRDNRLQDAIDRIREIYEQAKELQAHDLALEALAELATTQRQDRQQEERNRSLEILERIAMGDTGADSRLVYPAIAHLEYERGKVSDLGPADPPKLAHHLIASKTLFERLVETSRGRDTRYWRSRRAWSLVSLAHNYRDQSRFEGSLQYAAAGLRVFEELDDDYGRTQCWFLFGFCLRLLRRFDAAWKCLEQAHSIARVPTNSFERAIAYCLVQMGEVRRCQEQLGEAEELLDEALGEAKRLDLHLARAFATSGLAAVRFQSSDLEQAQTTLRSAQRVFQRCKHPEGIALNARRQATVARHLSSQGVAPDEPEVKRLISLSEKHYRSLGSPAGVAACEVERGWMRQISPSCGDLGEILDQLDHLLRDERGTLEQDAWVPRVLDLFARQAGSKPLAEEAHDIYSQSERHLEEQGEASVRRISDVADHFTEKDEGNPSTAVIEMGGESRRKSALLAA